MKRITIGGERLGSGKKMQTELHGYERSTHDKSYIWRSTMSAGTLVPFLKQIALPGSTYDIELTHEMLTHPTIGPLFGGYKVQLDIFEAPMKLYQGKQNNNLTAIGLKMNTVKLPVLSLQAPTWDTAKLAELLATGDIDNSQINPSCILSYLGIRGIGVSADGALSTFRNFNAIPYLMYTDIYKNYYANKQEEIGVVIHTTPQGPSQILDNFYLSEDNFATEEVF